MKNQQLSYILQFQEDVLRYCFFLCRNEYLAQDLAQDTFVKLLQNQQELKQAKAFLFQIAKNLYIDTLRKNKNEYKLNQIEIKSETVEGPDLAVWQVLFSLSEDDQEILLLVDREGLSLIEAAIIVKISEAAAKSRLLRARENFKKKWKS